MHVLGEHDYGNQQNPPLLKLHIKMLEQFKGPKTFTIFIEPCSQRNKLNNPGLACLILKRATRCALCIICFL
jgi:hypothetical protein